MNEIHDLSTICETICLAYCEITYQTFLINCVIFGLFVGVLVALIQYTAWNC